MSYLKQAGRLATLSLLLAATSACQDTPDVSRETRERLETAFPNTTFDRLYPLAETGLIAGESGETVVYFTQDGRYALVGNVLDLENRTDLTEQRRRELGDSAALEAKAFGPAAKPAPAPREPAQARPVPASSITVDLPAANLVTHNPGGSDVLYVVSDYNCSFCRRLHADLEGLDIEVREIPVSYMGQMSGLKAASALCSDDPAGTAKTFLDGREPTEITTCTEGEASVAENTAWAQARGISGTPFLILESGETRSGYLEPPALQAFLRAS